MAKVDIPEDIELDGFKLNKQLQGKKNRKRDEIFLNHFPHDHRSKYYTSMVQSDWKVVYHYPIKEDVRYELFNLKDDPFETTNLASENPKQLKKMMEVLVKEMDEKGALYPEKDGKILKLVLP